MEGDGDITLIEGQMDLTLDISYDLVLEATSQNWTNVYFRAVPEDDANGNDVHVYVTGYATEFDYTISAECTTGTGNDDDDEVNDGNLTCMVRLPAGYYCNVRYSKAGYETLVTTEAFLVEDIDAMIMDYVELEVAD